VLPSEEAGYQEVIDFWYSEAVRAQWFSSTPELDAKIKRRFEAVWKKAAQGELDQWKAHPEGCLALVIVLDQFPLNMYRGEAVSFSTEQIAVGVAQYAVESGMDRQLPSERLGFLYMPFMHSEQPVHQDMSVKLFSDAGLEANARFARHHRDIVRRFGRFPHRNAILGREHTTEELEYLASEEAFRG
jgi:uncharacterized protein (DUF924 family)